MARSLSPGWLWTTSRRVVHISANDIEQTPRFGGQTCIDYITGIAKVKRRVKALLDVDALVGAQKVKNLEISAA